MGHLKEIYDRQAERVYRICLIYMKNESDAQDGMQEVFLRLLEHPVSFEDEEHEKAWCIRTAKNYCLDQLKSFWRKKRSSMESWQEAAEINSSEEGALLEMVMQLPVKYRDVLYLYYYEEYSVREISGMLERKESTVQSQLAAGRKKLRREIEKEEIYGTESIKKCFRENETVR